MPLARRAFLQSLAPLALVLNSRCARPTTEPIAEASTPIAGPQLLLEPGRYHLTGDIVIRSVEDLVSGAALAVESPGVHLDLNGHVIRGEGLEPDAITFGIRGSGAGGLTVIDTLTGGIHGFWCGIHSDGHQTRVEELDLSGNFYMGANLIGDQTRAFYNRIIGIGGHTKEAYAVGLNLTGSGYHVRGNSLREIYRQPGAAASLPGEGCAILINTSSNGGVCERNWIENSRVEPATIGLFGGRGGPHTFTRNAVTGFHYGIASRATTRSPLTATHNTLVLTEAAADSAGILCDHGLAERNTIVNYATPVAGLVSTGAGNLTLPRA
jgi:hypothetical protein